MRVSSRLSLRGSVSTANVKRIIPNSASLTTETERHSSGPSAQRRAPPDVSYAHRNLAFAIEGAKNPSASANLAFLERDPTDRGPRAQFELEAAVAVRSYISVALQEARLAIDASVASSEPVPSANVNALQILVKTGEDAIKDMNEAIGGAHKRLNQLKNGVQPQDPSS